MAIPPSLLYASESGDLQDSWLEDFNHCHQSAYFGTSKKGWTSDQLGLAWLDRFHEATYGISGYQKRLLIIDGHSSHVNMAFITKAADYNILVVVFPPHSTHRLQPLDVSVFSPLAQAYSQGLDEFIASSRGFSRMTKRLFWSIFWPAWQKAVKYETITSGFTKTGIYPFNPAIVLDQLKPTTAFSSSEDSEEYPEPPTDVRGIRKLIKAVRQEKGAVSSNVDLLCQSIETLALHNDILRHENSFINETLIHEIKRRKRGKPMGLLGAEDAKYGQFWSPTKIAIRRQEIEAETQHHDQQKQQAADKKMQRQIDRDLKAQERRDRIEFNKQERIQKKAKREAEQLEKRRQRELKKALITTKEGPKVSRRVTNSQRKRSRPSHVTEAGNEEILGPITIARSGRKITIPTRFQD